MMYRYFFILMMYFLTPQVEAQAANGWSVQEMFAKNEQFGVKTSYDPNMAGYTVQLNREKMDSNEYRSAFPQCSGSGFRCLFDPWIGDTG